MKNIYKSLMAIAAAFLLVPTAFAQTAVLEGTDLGHEKYIIDTDKGIGYNKYLTSTTPDGNGNYTLRIENFITGDVKSTAVPTDFVLVLDNSGSMYYDYLPSGVSSMPNRIPFDNTTILPYFVHDYGSTDVTINYAPYVGATYNTVFTMSTLGATVPTSSNKISNGQYFYDVFKPEGTAHNVTRYYKYEDANNSSNNGYYRILQKKVGNYYNLAIKLQDGTYRYLYGDSISENANTSITTTTKIIYNGSNMYHIKSRKEALLDGVHAFLNLIAEENAKDQWATGVTKHQVSVVSFSVGYANNTASYEEIPTATPVNDTKVVKGFGEVYNTDTWYQYVTDRISFRGGQTAIDRGVNLARLLFEELQGRGAQYAALNATGGVNRNKVAVVFTDGEPYDTGRNFFQITNPCVKYGKTIKEVGIGKINGRIYSIDLRMSNSSKDFLEHLSSNYPKGDTDVTTGGYASNKFYGTKVPIPSSAVGEGKEFTTAEYEFLKKEQAIYYKDSKDGDLRSVFTSIAAANTGAMSSTLVAVDVMSNDFKIPFTSDDTDQVTMYTAQCIGKKKIDGVEYLAFAEPIKVADRLGLDDLWVIRNVTVGEQTVPTWVNLGEDRDGLEITVDIDNAMHFEVVEEEDAYGESKGKSIVVSGFNYSNLWCGHDGEHNNTRQIEDDDPNYAYQLDGYRGFKLIFEFPIKIDENALGGVNVPTNDWAHSGLYQADDSGNPQGNPEVNYPTPDLPVPVKLIIQKKGLQPGESANFTIQRKLIGTDSWEDFTTFVLTGDAAATPEIRFINLDASYYYKVKEGNWSWAYQNVSTEYTTENTELANPLVFNNTPEEETPKHAETKAVNRMYETVTSTTTTINSK